MPKTLLSSPPDRMSARQARFRLRISLHQLQKLVILGRLRVIAEPGTALGYDRASVERLAAELGIDAPAPSPSEGVAG